MLSGVAACLADKQVPNDTFCALSLYLFHQKLFSISPVVFLSLCPVLFLPPTCPRFRQTNKLVDNGGGGLPKAQVDDAGRGIIQHNLGFRCILSPECDICNNDDHVFLLLRNPLQREFEWALAVI